MNSKQECVLAIFSECSFTSTADLKRLFEEIDLNCLDSFFANYAAQGWKYTFSWGKRLSKTAAQVATHRSAKRLDFVFSSWVFQTARKAFETVGVVQEVNGMTAGSIQQAFLHVMEHEMCHGYLGILGQSNEGSHGPQFQGLAKLHFGHTHFRHSLFTSSRTARANGVRVGTRVTFKPPQRKRSKIPMPAVVEGRVVRIMMRATVQTDAGKIWHVPINMLEAK